MSRSTAWCEATAALPGASLLYDNRITQLVFNLSKGWSGTEPEWEIDWISVTDGSYDSAGFSIHDINDTALLEDGSASSDIVATDRGSGFWSNAFLFFWSLQASTQYFWSVAYNDVELQTVGVNLTAQSGNVFGYPCRLSLESSLTAEDFTLEWSHRNAITTVSVGLLFFQEDVFSEWVPWPGEVNLNSRLEPSVGPNDRVRFRLVMPGGGSGGIRPQLSELKFNVDRPSVEESFLSLAVADVDGVRPTLTKTFDKITSVTGTVIGTHGAEGDFMQVIDYDVDPGPLIKVFTWADLSTPAEVADASVDITIKGY
jgi:hypothetical protein